MDWNAAFLNRITQADGLRIAPLRDDGVTLGTPTFIWAVVAEGRLFVRAYSGTGSSWYRAALRQLAGRIQLAEEGFDVRFAPVAAGLKPAIDAAYRTKYADSRYLGAMISDRASAATVEVLPA